MRPVFRPYVVNKSNTMSEYSPFQKQLIDLEPEDLCALKDATEGWYIEYKREAPNSSAIAKSLSAFANTYGGWLFYGVQEKSKEEAVAGSFPGIARAEIDAVLQRMRQAAAGQVNPAPHFDTKVLWGPCESIGLADDRAVICAHVPWSPIAPHVHKGGHIYRRVADGSEPKPENDRFVLDQLWRRADDLREDYRRWVERDPEFSEGESERPYVRLMLVANLWQDRDCWLDASLEDIRDIMSEARGLLGAIPFETVYTSATGFVARQLPGNDPQNLGLTWRLRPHLVSEVIIPLSLYAPDPPVMLRGELHGYDEIGRFTDELIRQGHRSPRVVDLNYLFNLLIGVAEIQRRLTSKAGWSHGYFFKARLLNVWRTIPFVDVPIVLDRFVQHGIPMCLDSKVTTPGGLDPDSFTEVSEYADIDDDRVRLLLQTLDMFAPIARAFGVPTWVTHDPAAGSSPYHDELQRAGRRAMEVQRQRNDRLRERN